MAAPTHETGVHAQRQLGDKRENKKLKAGSGETEESSVPNINKRERKRLKKALVRAERERERREIEAARLRKSALSGTGNGEAFDGRDEDEQMVDGDDEDEEVPAKSTQEVAEIALLDESQTQDSGAANLSKKKHMKSKSKKQKFKSTQASETFMDPGVDESPMGIDTLESPEKLSKIKNRKHKLDTIDLSEVTDSNTHLLSTSAVAEDDEAPRKKRKTKKSKLSVHHDEHQTEAKTALCDKCGTIGHTPETCTVGIVCFNCKLSGHYTEDCLLKQVCNICQSRDHVATNCKALDSQARRKNTIKMTEEDTIVDSPKLAPNSQSQDLSFDLDNLPRYDTLREEFAIENTPKKVKEKMYSIPARFVTPDVGVAKKEVYSARTAAMGNYTSSDEEGDQTADMKPTTFLRTSSFMSSHKESPILPPGAAYRHNKDGSPSPTGRATPKNSHKQSKITSEKKIKPLETKTGYKKSVGLSNSVAKEEGISSLQREIVTIYDSDSGDSLQLQTQRKETGRSETSGRSNCESSSPSEEDVDYSSSDNPLDSDSDSDIERRKALESTPVFTVIKKETPILPPKLVALSQSTSSKASGAKSTPIPVPVPKFTSGKLASTKQGLLPVSTTPIPPPAARNTNFAPTSNNVASPPRWMTTELARINTKIKGERASEEGWEGSLLGGGLKRGFSMTGLSALLQKNGQHAEDSENEKPKSQDMKVIADDWEKVPGRVRGSVDGDDGDVVENIAYAPSYFSTKSNGITIASNTVQTTFLTLQLSPSSPPQALSNLYPNELMVCSVTDGKVQVTLNKTRFSASKGSMWRVRGGEECTIRHAGRAGKDAVVMGVVVREARKG